MALVIVRTYSQGSLLQNFFFSVEKKAVLIVSVRRRNVVNNGLGSV